MLLSISSSSQKSIRTWAAIFGVAILQVVIYFSLWEIYWRNAGHTITMIDTPQLWAIQRSNVYRPNTVVFLGASRTQYGVSIPEVKKNLPNSNPVMLAVNGAYPLSTLKHLANDDSFKGLVIVDIDTRGMVKANHDNQQYLVEYYDKHWNLNWYYHRLLLNYWQSFVVSSQPQLAFPSVAAKLLENYTPPFVAYSTIFPARDGYLDFARIDPKALADNFAHGLEQALSGVVAPSPDKWFNELQEVVGWVRDIERRGGKVVFYEPPVSGRQASLVDEVFDRDLYWNVFFQKTGISSLSYRDEPLLQGFSQPDESHIEGIYRAAYTRNLIASLRERGHL